MRLASKARTMSAIRLTGQTGTLRNRTAPRTATGTRQLKTISKVKVLLELCIPIVCFTVVSGFIPDGTHGRVVEAT